MHQTQPSFKPVYIFGAGASKAIGGPLVNDFLTRSKELVYSPDFTRTMHQDFMREKLSKEFQKLFQYQKRLLEVREYLGIDLNNLETLFSILDMDLQVAGADISPNSPPVNDPKTLQEIREAFFSVIIATLKVSIHREKTNYDYIIQSFAGDENATFITFNYDNAIEGAIESLLDRGQKKYFVDYGYAAQEILNRSPNGRFVLKLHGSADWTYCSVCKRLTPLKEYITPVEVESNRARLHIESGCSNLTAINLMIPPSWNKVDSLPEITRVWARAIREISFATHLFIIGYSFPRTDAFFDQMLTLGLRNSRNIKRVVVINPDQRINDVIGTFFDPYFLSRSVTYLKLRFEDLMHGMPVAIRTDLEMNQYLERLSALTKSRQ